MNKSDRQAIEKYRRRRIQRLRVRFDDDEENAGNNGGRRGGHGNTRIPFGLCQREGIQVDPKWTPKDAWNALEGKGYSAGETYAQLKKTGSTAKKAAGARMKTQRMQTRGLHGAFFKGAGLKKFQAFNTEFQKMELEEHISDFVANAGAIAQTGAGLRGEMKLVKAKAGGGDHLKVWHNRLTGECVKAQLTVPDIDKVPEQYRQAEASTFAHELVHYMNFCARDGGKYGNYTDGDATLTEAVRKARTGKIGDKAKSLLEESARKWTDTHTAFKQETERKDREINDRWMKRSEELGDRGTLPHDEYVLYKKEKDAFRAGRMEELDLIKESIDGGAAAFSNMYDALTFGKYGSEGRCYFQHGMSYYQGRENLVKNEMLSIYVEMHMAKNKKYLELFRQDQPELAAALDNTIRTLLKRGGVA